MSTPNPIPEPKTPHDLNAVLAMRRQALQAALQAKKQQVVLAEATLITCRADADECAGALRELEMVIGTMRPMLAPSTVKP